MQNINTLFCRKIEFPPVTIIDSRIDYPDGKANRRERRKQERKTRK